jgi:predicted ATPase
MTERRLASIEVEGFTSILQARVLLGQLNVLVGANGAGKSNFIQAFEMLGRLVEEDLGFFVGVNGGASAC